MNVWVFLYFIIIVIIQLSEALEMCLQYNAIITEEMAEKLTPSPTENG